MSKNILYVAIGDIGHSPRTLLHIQESLSLDKVRIVGCAALLGTNLFIILESSIPDAISAHPKFMFHDLKSISINKRSIFYPIFAVFKFFILFLNLFWLLVFKPAVSWDVIICQNPPSIPLFLVVYMSRLFARHRFTWIIDWHNLGHTLLPPRHSLFISIYKLLELKIGMKADYHLTVTQSLKNYLVSEGYRGDTIVVAKDYPREITVIGNRQQMHDCLVKMEQCLWKSSDAPLERWLSLNPKIFISSTSWTPDEDFGILLEAIDCIEKKQTLKQHILIIITGKGPCKETFIEKLSKVCISWKYVNILLGWFSLKDYYRLLSASDMGISFHKSSSGFDFPMKIIDMISCSTPCIAALEFPCLMEEINSLDVSTDIFPFSTKKQLADVVLSLADSQQKPKSPKPRQAKFSAKWKEYMKQVLPNCLS